MTKLKQLIVSKIDIITILGLFILFYIIFFYNLGNYPLMDVDESRYVSMAKDMYNSKDYLTLYLNNEYFFEKPPLYFWLECLSFKFLGGINEFNARFPGALIGASCCLLLYLMGKKLVSRKYGILSALILATSLEYVILSKFAILDIVVSSFVSFSLLLGIIVYFCRESRRKYYWWLFYICSGLAVMAKGLPGFIIPFGSMFFISIISNKFKDIFKPTYFIPGIILFLLIVLPWHVIMLNQYNSLFWDEYIIKHHLARFMGSSIIDRKQPFYFYFITLLWGFFPWIFSSIGIWIKALIEIYKSKKIYFDYNNFSVIQKFLLFNSIIAVFILFFFSISGTKLITYILPIYPHLACLTGYVWLKYIESNKNHQIINTTNYIIAGIMLLACIAGILTPLYLPTELIEDISETKLFCILTPFTIGLALILFTKKRNYIGVFASLVLFMTMFSAFATKDFFEIDYKFGQNDLMKFALYAKDNDISLTTFNFGHKYSLLYYGEKPVIFGPQLEPKDLEKTLHKDKNMVIIRLKDIKYLINKDFDIIDIGRKYALIEESLKRK